MTRGRCLPGLIAMQRLPQVWVTLPNWKPSRGDRVQILLNWPLHSDHRLTTYYKKSIPSPPGVGFWLGWARGCSHLGYEGACPAGIRVDAQEGRLPGQCGTFYRHSRISSQSWMPTSKLGEAIPVCIINCGVRGNTSHPCPAWRLKACLGEIPVLPPPVVPAGTC